MRFPPFLLERYYAAHEFNVRYMLGSSDCEALTVEELLALEPGSEQAFGRLWLGYTESAGAPGLRAEIAKIYRQITPRQVLVHAGAEEAILLYMQAVLNPGDHVIVQTPCYQSTLEIPRAIGCDVSPWAMRYDGEWKLDLADLEAIIRPDTRLLVLNSPHNPTGFQIPKPVQRQIFEMAKRCGARIFFDEVYRELEYGEADRLPAGCDLYEKATSLGVMSKTYGLPGLRIGWVATADSEVLDAMAKLKDYTTICNSAPSEFLAELGLRRRKTLAARNLRIVQENLAILDEFFVRHAGRFEWKRPIAGPIAFPKLLGLATVDDFCLDAIRRANVMLVPGTLFGVPGHFRIGFGRRNLPEALAQLEHLLSI